MENGQEDASLCGLGEAVTAKGDDVITCLLKRLIISSGNRPRSYIVCYLHFGAVDLDIATSSWNTLSDKDKAIPIPSAQSQDIRLQPDKMGIGINSPLPGPPLPLTPDHC